MLVSRGSAENMDDLASQVDSGHSQIRAFDLSSLPAGKPYDYASQGKMLGWGLRNSVGVAEEPITGGIYSVENSADQLQRSGTDIHQDNPGEEMNFHGFLNGSTESQGGNYGYPDCFAVWDTNLPNLGSMKVGSQFALNPSSTLDDTTCAEKYVAPRLTFQVRTSSPLAQRREMNLLTTDVVLHTGPHGSA
jgi:glucose/arabinose dehydrogenase